MNHKIDLVYPPGIALFALLTQFFHSSNLMCIRK